MNPHTLARRVAFSIGLVAGAFAFQFTTSNLGSVDGYFHIRYSEILRSGLPFDLSPPFPWLPLTILSEDRYFDHHWLFHLWLALFAGGDLILGAKLAAAIGAAAALLGCYGFLLWQRVTHPELWMAALLAAAPGFLYRLEMPRVQAWSLLFLLATLALLIRRRDIWLLPVAWLYTWLYDAFPLMLGLCACATIARVLLSRRVTEWRPLVYAGAGVAGGLLINPYVPNNLFFIYHHYRAKLDPSLQIPVGAEWSPILIAQWTGWAGLLSLLVAVGILLYLKRQYLDETRLTLILVALLFWVFLWNSTRFVEYTVPFTTFALAVPLYQIVRARLSAASPTWRRRSACALGLWLTITVAVGAYQMRSRPPAHRYAAASRWIQGHAPAGALIFTADWDDFPQLFFHNTRNRYVLGLDPTYLAERDRELYQLWYDTAAGYREKPAAAIVERFGASVALTDHEHTAFIRAMDDDPQAQRAYEDGDAIVYMLRVKQ